jgi:hypothetical protein
VQNEILSKNPSADLRVYVVWFNMFPGDARWRWDGDGMTDPRVTHFWDEQKTIGTWFSTNLTDRGSPTWDFYALYRPDTPDLVSPSSMGGTIIGRRDELQTALMPILQTTAGSLPHEVYLT